MGRRLIPRLALYLALAVAFAGLCAAAGSPAAQRCTTTIRTIISTVTVTAPTTTATEPATTTTTTACTRTLEAGAGSLSSFVASLAPGDTGCLSGVFVGALAVSNAGFTLEPVPGGAATLDGCLWLRSTADQVTLRSLSLRSHGACFSVVLGQGDRTVFDHDDIFGGNVKNCVLLGYGGESDPANVANDVTVTGSRIHDCGDDSHEHGIYAEFTRRLHVTDSYIYAAGGGGIQFYPDADDSLVEYSVIDGNDLGAGYAWNILFAGEQGGGEYASAHQSERNIITRSLVTFASPGVAGQDVDSYWPGGVGGAGNEVSFSCVYSPGDTLYAGGGYTQHDNVQADPLYVDEAAHDYALQASSPCAGLGPR